MTASEDTTVRLWNIQAGEGIAVFTADSAVCSVAILQKDRAVIFGTQKGIVGSLALCTSVDEVRALPSFVGDDMSRKVLGSRPKTTVGAADPNEDSALARLQAGGFKRGQSGEPEESAEQALVNVQVCMYVFLSGT